MPVLVGASLGPVRGVSSLSLYALLGIAGAPVYTGQNHGWEYFSGATGGYIVGFVLAAGLTGWLAEQRGWDHRLSSSIAVMLTGSVVIYVARLVWLAQVIDAGLERTLEAGLYPFVVGDLLKLYLAAALLPAAWRLVEHVRRDV